MTFRVSSIAQSIRSRWRNYELRKKERQFMEVIDGVASLLEAGLPFRQAFMHVTKLVRTPWQRAYVDAALKAIDAGEPLSRAWSGRVPHLLLLLLIAGEQGGKIPYALRTWSRYVAHRQMWRTELSRTLTYPIILAVMTVALFIFVISVVLPTIDGMYAQLNLPPHRTVKTIEYLMYRIPEIAIFALLSTLLAAIACMAIRHRVPEVWNKIRSHLPGVVLRCLYRTNVFCLLLHLLIDAGIPLVDALETLRVGGYKSWLCKTASTIHSRILDGQRLTHAFEWDWDPAFTVFVGWAEQTGDLARALKDAEHLTRERLKQRIEEWIRYAEPIMVVIMGAVVGVTMLVLFVPMYEMITAISSGG
jgi:type II secretory pathway component PulF